MRRALPVLVLIAGCASPPGEQPGSTGTAPSVTPSSTATPGASSGAQGKPLKKETLAYLAKRGLQPIAGGVQDARANCSFRDENGYGGQLRLQVKAARVEQLEARVEVPKRGHCEFRLADFSQTETQPAIVLASRQGNCKVSLWEQGQQLTVAFRDCRNQCSGGAADYLWPILVDSRKGGCF